MSARKEGLRRISILYWLWGKTKDEEKVDLLNVFLVSVLNSKTSYSLGTQPPELEDGDEEHNEALIIQREMVSDLLLRQIQVMGPDWIHTRILSELVEMLIKPLVSQQSWLPERSWLTGS